MSELPLDTLVIVGSDNDHDCDEEQFSQEHLAVSALPKSGQMLEVNPLSEHPTGHDHAGCR